MTIRGRVLKILSRTLRVRFLLSFTVDEVMMEQMRRKKSNRDEAERDDRTSCLRKMSTGMLIFQQLFLFSISGQLQNQSLVVIASDVEWGKKKKNQRKIQQKLFSKHF